MTDVAPRLSVIIAATSPFRDVPACLPAVVQRCRDPQVEILLAYSADSALPEAMTAGYGDVIFIRLPQATSLPQLLGAAIARAKGETIAITDATCAVDEGWVSAILKAHEASQPIIGGAVEPDGLRTLVDWSAYFFDYGPFMCPLITRVVRTVPGLNISMKRWALAKGKEFVEGEFWKGYWCRQLQAEGFPLYVEPSLVVFYRKSFTLWPLLLLRFHHGRCFAGMRLAQLSGVGRIIYVVGSPVLPFLFCWRLLKEVLPKRHRLRQFLLSLPLTVLGMVSWTLGECVGYLLGPGTSCRHVR